MDNETATPETGTVDAPVSMEDIISEIATGKEPADIEAEVVQELVEEAEEGHSEEEADEEEATEPTDEAEETDEEKPEETDDANPTHKVKVNGEEVEVPLSELLKGYSREQDYTAKTMALAEEKKNLGSRFARELEQHVKLFEALDPILSEARNIDWQNLAQADPAAYVQLRAAVDQRLAVVTEARRKIAAEREGETKAEQAQQAESAQAETKALIKAVPELADPKAMGSFAQNAVNYLRGTGYGDGEIAELTDHRALLIVDKARRFDEIEKAKATLPSKKVVSKPAARSLRTDGSHSSSAPKPRFPGKAAPLEQRLAFVTKELLKQE